MKSWVVHGDRAWIISSRPSRSSPTTAWLHRTTLADVMGMPSEAGVGGRCAEWTSLDNTTADGERFYYISNPALGLWASKSRLS